MNSTDETPTIADLVNGLVRLRGSNLKEFSAQIGCHYSTVRTVIAGREVCPAVRAKIEAALSVPLWSTSEEFSARQTRNKLPNDKQK